MKAVIVGTLVGAAIPLCVTVPLAFSGELAIWQRLYLASLPLIVSFAIVLPASTVIGLPFFLVLKKLNAESAEFYILPAALFGLLIPALVLVLIGAQDGYWLCALGPFSGVATAWTWWRARTADRPLTTLSGRSRRPQ